MRDVLLLLCVLLAATALAAADHARDGARAPASEGCLACHAQVDDPGPAHPVAALGCSPCHGGDPHSRDKRRAHQGLVDNPGDLRVVDTTCGRDGCHVSQAARVRTSVMTTNAGILAALARLWGVRATDAADRVKVVSETAAYQPGQDYYAKLCATCHFRRRRDLQGGEPGLRGGGCSGCHVVRPAGERDEALTRLEHPRLSMRVPTRNCVRCHNRSARIGLTYQGLLEDDGYGTPHVRGGPGDRRLSGGRHYLHIPADVHFLAGMACIDCHTGREVMGDGTAHRSLKEQLEIACADCHEPRFDGQGALPGEAARLARLNTAVPPLEAASAARSATGSPLYALRLVRAPRGAGPGKAVLYRKLDGEPLEMDWYATPRAHHALPGHERLGCQSCHSPVMPQCYGCHVEQRGDAAQRDNILGAETPGRWIESRSFTRFESPPLGIAHGGSIAPFSPCQVVVSAYDAAGSYDGEASVGRALMSSFDPHSTRLRSRTCLDCHLDSKALGLGAGRLVRDPGPSVRHTYDAAASGLGWSMAPEQLTGLDGRLAQSFARSGDRPLRPDELRAVLGVAPCLPCHGSYDDSLWAAYARGRQRLRDMTATGCELNGALTGRDAPPGVHSDSSPRDKLLHDTSDIARR